MATYNVSTPVGEHRLVIKQETIIQDDTEITHYRGEIKAQGLQATGKTELAVYEALLVMLSTRQL